MMEYYTLSHAGVPYNGHHNYFVIKDRHASISRDRHRTDCYDIGSL